MGHSMRKKYLSAIIERYPIFFASAWFGGVTTLGYFRPSEPTGDYENRYKGFVSTYYVSDLDLIVIRSAFILMAAVALIWLAWVVRHRKR